MLIIPAIDLRGGQCVRLVQGRLDNETVYSKDPIFMARLWQAKGARRIHITDLDGAFSGRPQNLSIIKAIRKKVDVPIMVGGGMRSAAAIGAALKAGVDSVILGTAVVYNPGLVKKMVDKWGARIILGIDAKEGKVAIAGWKEVTSVLATDLVATVNDLGVKEIVCTDVKRDGTLTGPNVDGIRRMARAAKAGVIAAGGVSSLEDVRRMKELEPEGVVGLIIGKALYTEAIKLEDAIPIGG